MARSSGCEEDACWVCLEGPSDSIGILEHPCACPRGVHARCLARWQLQSAGREEERYCRFCKSELPDWRSILAPKVPAAPPVMAIVYDGKVVRLQVKPGREGMLEFQRQVRAAFGLGEDVELDCVFDCRAPGTGEKVKLHGLESYSAAMHCASVSAGERLARMGAPRSGGCGGSSSGASSCGASASGSSSGGGSSSRSSGAGSASSTGGGGGGGECERAARQACPGFDNASRTSASPAAATGAVSSPAPAARTPPTSPLLARALAACKMTGSRRGSPAAGQAEGVAAGARAGADTVSPGPSGGRRRSGLIEMFKGLSAARRIM